MAFNVNTPVATNQIAVDLVAINANWELTAPGKVTAAGDIIYATAANVIAALPIGTAGQILEVNSTPDAPAWVSKGVVQVVSTQSGAVNTGTTALPSDDTIPQITEGDEYMTRAITPESATNVLKIDVVCHISNSNVNQPLTVALFQDATAGALACASHYQSEDTGIVNIAFSHYMVSGTAIETTFRVRAGGTTGATTTFNGSAAGRLFGGVIASSITITEIRA